MKDKPSYEYTVLEALHALAHLPDCHHITGAQVRSWTRRMRTMAVDYALSVIAASVVPGTRIHRKPSWLNETDAQAALRPTQGELL